MTHVEYQRKLDCQCLDMLSSIQDKELAQLIVKQTNYLKRNTRPEETVGFAKNKENKK